MEQHHEIANISLELNKIINNFSPPSCSYQAPDVSGVFIKFTEGEEPEDQSEKSSNTLTGNEMRSKSFNFTALEYHYKPLK